MKNTCNNTIKSKRYALLRAILLSAIILVVSVSNSRANVLFIHDYAINEFMIGTKKAELAILYTDDKKLIDKKTTYTGSFLKKWFGSNQTIRETTHILLNEDVIREIDYVKHNVLDFPLERITSPEWYDKYSKEDIPSITREMVDSKYQVLAPVFTIKTTPGNETINNYSCKHVTADVRLETIDKKKNAASITHIKLDLWLTNEIQGFSEYQSFNEKLGKRLGLDAVRLGPLANLLDNWQGSLEPIKHDLDDIQGYPVKSDLSVTAVYKTKTDTSSPEITKKEIKTVSDILQKVIPGQGDFKRFSIPADYKIVTIK